ncbi:IS5 family transposase [Lichenifustis flavocetrariae]|uniref:IS5 family transposase n=1 Tax=Lichenifustis flavocetrariae TaxID=2949735 RepID=A0AA41Z201_9HYPH|nr:IS5 family transposase [Lichenifustis flavocetrariae]MCW6512756.1 IS5 family transposase [Lichenifustis flavocetrariae]
MRGTDEQTGSLFSYQSPESMVPGDHPLRVIRSVVNAALERLSPEFSQLYSPYGRASIAPEKLLRALLVQAFFGVRSERQLMEQVRYNMLFRWFIGLSMDAPVWDVTVFTKNRDRLLEGEIARSFLLAVLADPKVKPLLSDEHFSVDGTIIEAWASMKSFQPKDGSDSLPSDPGRNGERDFRGEKRSNETHQSVTDPEARLYRKSDGQPAKLCYLGHVLMENRNGLIVDAELTQATGWAERAAAEAMVETTAPAGGVTLGADKGYDTKAHVANLRDLGVTPHVAQNQKNRCSAIDGRTTRHPGYAISQCIRKRIEEPFGWMKAAGGFRQTKHRGRERVGWMFTLRAAAYNLIRLPNLLATT